MHILKTTLTIAAALGATLLAGCGGGAQHSMLPSQPVHSANAQQVTFKIDVPRTTSSTNKRSPLYVSPATTQMAIDVQTGCPASCVSYTGYPVTQALTPTSGGCTSTLANTQCQISLALPPNSYTATLTTEDAAGTALSTAQSIAFTVVAGTANVIPIVLSGIPAAIVAATVSATSQAVIVNALDADNNIIIGSGAPSFTVTETGGIALTLTQPTTTSPNMFTAKPAVGGTAILNVAASYSGSGVTDACTQSGAVCSANFTLTSAAPLFVPNYDVNTVTEYAPPYTGTPTTISDGINSPYALAFDTSGNLFVMNIGAYTVTEYAPPYTGAPTTTISDGISYPQALVLDPSGNLFVANYNNTVTEYAPPYTGTPITTISSGIADPFALALDPSGNLFVANLNTNTVTEYASPYTGAPIATISDSVNYPDVLKLDPNGDLFVGNYGNDTITKYASPYTGTPTTISTGISGPDALALDSNSNLFVANASGNTVTEYAPPYTGAPTTVSNGIGAPYGLAFDIGGNLFAANYSANTVTEYAPPYTGTPTTISTGISEPYGLVFGTRFLISIAP